MEFEFALDGSSRLALGFGLANEPDRLRLATVRDPLAHQLSISAGPVPHQTAVNTDGLKVTVGPQDGERKGIPSEQTGFVLRRKDEQVWTDEHGKQAFVALQGLRLGAVQHLSGTAAYVPMSPALERLRAAMESLDYLQPERPGPRRQHDRDEIADQMTSDGGNVASVLLNSAEKTTHCFFPPPIPRSREDARKQPSPEWTQADLPLREAVAKWMGYLGLASGLMTRLTRPTKIELLASVADGQPRRSLADLGYGVSQVLPVIVAGLLGNGERLLVVDLPEAHLHPAAQAGIGDFLCALALAGQRLLVETHSEMLFHRLRLRAAQSSRVGELVNVLFLDGVGADQCLQNPRKIELAAEAELHWPAAFLVEPGEEELAIRLAQDANQNRQR